MKYMDKFHVYTFTSAPVFRTVPLVIFCASAILLFSGTTAASIEEWQLDPVKNAIYRTPELKYALFEKPSSSQALNRAARLTSKRGLVLARRNVETIDPFKNCYFSPVQCVFYEDRKKK